MTDPLGQSQVLPYLTGLSQEGYEFHLISFEKKDRLEKHRKHIQKMCDDAGISWHPQDYSFGGLRRNIKQVRRMIKVSEYLFDRHKFDLIHCRSYISALAGLKLKYKYYIPFVFDMRGFWADERVDGKLWDLKNPLYKLIFKYFKRKEKEFVLKADAIVSLTSAGKEEMKTWHYGEIENKTSVIPCCVDLDLFNSTHAIPEDRSAIRERLGIGSSESVLGYVGSIGTWYMLDEMLDFYNIYRKKNQQSIFLFISGENREKILNVSRRKNIPDNEIIVTSVTHDQVARHIAAFDLSVFFILPSYSKKASSPTKQGELMAMGIPLVCNAGVGDTAEIVERYHAGSVVHEFSEEAYERALIELSRFDRNTSISGAQEYFSLDHGVKLYQDIYQKLIG